MGSSTEDVDLGNTVNLETIAVIENLEKSFVHNTLTKWGLETYIEAFDREEIDKDTFMNIQPLILQTTLISKAGPLTRFLMNREKLINSSKAAIDETKKKDKINSQCKKSLNSNKPKVPLNLDEINAVSDSEISEVPGDEDAIEGTNTRPVKQCSLRESTKKRILDNTHGVEHSDETITPKRVKQVENYSVLQTLENSSTGQRLLKEYRLNNPPSLCETSSNQLCQIIIDDIVNDSKTSLKKDDFLRLRNQIATIFPNEDHTIYYTAPISKLVSSVQKSEPARGRLYERYRNVLKLHRKLDNSIINLSQTEESAETEDDVTEALQWLKHNKQPWKEVVQNWRKTLKYRYENLTKTAGTIDDYINQYPILAHSDGFTLISLDFHELFKSKDIFTAWEPFFEWSYSTASANKLRKAKDLTILLSADVSEYTKIVVQILLLAYIFPPRSCYKVKVGNKYTTRKPSIKECQTSLITRANSANDLSQIHEEKIKQLANDETVQPYIVAVGPKWEEIANYCIVVDKIRYIFDSPLVALQTWFHIYYACHAEAPFACKHIIYILQRILFQFSTEYDHMIPSYVRNLEKKFELENTK